MFVVLSILLVSIVFIIVLLDLYRKRHLIKFSRNYKGYRFYPIIGNAYHTVEKDLLTVVDGVKQKFGLPGNFWNGHEYHYVTADASEIKVICNHPSAIEKSSFYDIIATYFGNVLILAKYDLWRQKRKLMSKNFSQSVLSQFVEGFNKQACILVDVLKDSDSRDKYDIFCRLSADSFFVNVLETDRGFQNHRDNGNMESIERCVEIFTKKVFTVHFVPKCTHFLFPEGREVSKIITTLWSMVDETVKRFKQASDDTKNKKKLSLLFSLLNEEGKMFSNKEILNEICQFSMAAIDTSGHALTHIFTLLGMYPEAQEKVYEEVNQVVGLDNPVEYGDLANLKYTERVILESMRLLPAVPLIERYAQDDIDLGTKKVPAGSHIIISMFHLNRSGAYWENPLEFNPDRFLPEEIAKRHPNAYIPFSLGPRDCIGKRYAMVSMKIAVAHVIRKYKVMSKYKSVKEMQFISVISMKTSHEIDCRFIARDQ